MKRKENQKRIRKARGEAGTFLSGVFILSFSTILVKLLGLASKIPLIARLGAEGMGYFNSAYELYALLCVVCTTGFPTALSLLVSGENAETDEGRQRLQMIGRASSALFWTLGIAGSALLLVLAKPLAQWIGNPNAFLGILAIAPALLAVCVASSIRGYFQGLRNMVPTAVSQLLEAGGKLVFGVWLAELALGRSASLPETAAWAVFGVSAGCLLSVLFLLLYQAKHSDRKTKVMNHTEVLFPKRCSRKIFGEMVKIAFPITIASTVMSFTRIVDMTMMIRRLQSIGLSSLDANRLFGAYTTLALPVFSLLPSLIAPISMALIPQLNSAICRNSLDGQKHATETSLRLTVLLSMPASMGIVLFAEPILTLLFPAEAEANALCAHLLSALGVSILFSCLITTTNAILQAYRHTALPILSMGCGVVVKIISEYILMGFSNVGAYGAPISTFLCNVTVTALNLYFVFRYAKGVAPRLSGFLLRPILPSVISVLCAYLIYMLLVIQAGNAIALLSAIATAAAVYGCGALLTGGIRRADFQLLPFAHGLRRLFGRFFTETKRESK